MSESSYFRIPNAAVFCKQTSEDFLEKNGAMRLASPTSLMSRNPKLRLEDYFAL